MYETDKFQPKCFRLGVDFINLWNCLICQSFSFCKIARSNESAVTLWVCLQYGSSIHLEIPGLPLRMWPIPWYIVVISNPVTVKYRNPIDGVTYERRSCNYLNRKPGWSQFPFWYIRSSRINHSNAIVRSILQLVVRRIAPGTLLLLLHRPCSTILKSIESSSSPLASTSHLILNWYSHNIIMPPQAQVNLRNTRVGVPWPKRKFQPCSSTYL